MHRTRIRIKASVLPKTDSCNFSLTYSYNSFFHISIATMKVQLYQDAEAASTALAEHIIKKINDFQPTESKPFVIGLPTGSSPEGVYAKLVAAYKAGRVDFSNVVSFNMDEYLGLAPDHPQSYHYFMYQHLFNHVNFKPENINILNGLAEDVEAECAAYEAKIKKYGGIQLFMGGLGPEGHIAFNEAGSSRDSVTRRVTLVESTIKANSRFFENDESKVPRYALSVGISTVLDNSEEVAIIVLGQAKQKALSETIRHKVDASFPSTYLQTHPNVVIVADFAAVESFQSKL